MKIRIVALLVVLFFPVLVLAQMINETGHNQNVDFLRGRLEVVNTLTQEQKNDLVKYFEDQCDENILLEDLDNSEDLSFFDRIASDANMTQEQRKIAIKDYFAQKEQFKDKAEKDKIRAERTDEFREKELNSLTISPAIVK